MQPVPTSSPGNVTLYEGADCTGQARVVQLGQKEARCKNCFDICNKRFGAEPYKLTSAAAASAVSGPMHDPKHAP